MIGSHRVLSFLVERISVILQQQILDFDAGAEQQPNPELVVEFEVQGHLVEFESTASHPFDVVDDGETSLLDGPGDVFRC